MASEGAVPVINDDDAPFDPVISDNDDSVTIDGDDPPTNSGGDSLTNSDSDPITTAFEAAAAISSSAVLEFIDSGNEEYDFSLDYFSHVNEVKVNTKCMKVICVDGREYEFAEAPPNGIQEIIARNALRVTAKGCNAKFNPFLASFENLDYLFCQFRTKYIRDRLAYEFFVEDVVLDVRGVTYEVINDFKASCGILRLYKAEDFIASISPVPEGVAFPDFKEIYTFADYSKGKSINKRLEGMSRAIANVPKAFPESSYTSLVFNLGEFPEAESFDEFIDNVSALFTDAPAEKSVHVACVFCYVKRGQNFNTAGWSFYNYSLQAKKKVKISAKHTLHLIIDPRNGPKKYARTLTLPDEEQNGQLPDEWYDEVHQFI